MPTDHPKTSAVVSTPYPRMLAIGAGFVLTLAALMLLQAMGGSPPPA